jgi:uncharacterized membrane protein
MTKSFFVFTQTERRKKKGIHLGMYLSFHLSFFVIFKRMRCFNIFYVGILIFYNKKLLADAHYMSTYRFVRTFWIAPKRPSSSQT